MIYTHRLLLLFTLVSMGSCFFLYSQENTSMVIVRVELPYTPQFDFDSLQALDFKNPKPVNLTEEMQIVEQVLSDEINWILNGMIFGYSFSYVPSDKLRQVKEEWSLELLGRIPEKHRLPDIIPLFETNTISTEYYYPLSQNEMEIEQQLHVLFRTKSVGISSLDFEQGKTRIAVLEQAIKEAIRAALRTQIFNKPEKIMGKVLLTDSPSLWYKEGKYYAQVQILFLVEEMRKYKNF